MNAAVSTQCKLTDIYMMMRKKESIIMTQEEKKPAPSLNKKRKEYEFLQVLHRFDNKIDYTIIHQFNTSSK